VTQGKATRPRRARWQATASHGGGPWHWTRTGRRLLTHSIAAVALLASLGVGTLASEPLGGAQELYSVCFGETRISMADSGEIEVVVGDTFLPEGFSEATLHRLLHARALGLAAEFARAGTVWSSDAEDADPGPGDWLPSERPASVRELFHSVRNRLDAAADLHWSSCVIEEHLGTLPEVTELTGLGVLLPFTLVCRSGESIGTVEAIAMVSADSMALQYQVTAIREVGSLAEVLSESGTIHYRLDQRTADASIVSTTGSLEVVDESWAALILYGETLPCYATRVTVLLAPD
jgi:hypothetical protein